MNPLLTENLVGQFDPTSHYSAIPEKRLESACGVLPLWAVDSYHHLHETAPEETNPSILLNLFLDKMTDLYGFGAGATLPMNGIINTQGIFQFPEDPDQYPLRVIRSRDLKPNQIPFTFYQYRNAIVAWTFGTEPFYITRMD